MKHDTQVQTIICPKCGEEIPLSQVLTKQIEDRIRNDYEERLRKKDSDLEAALKSKEYDYKDKLQREREKIEAQAKAKAAEEYGGNIKALQDELQDKSKSLEESKKRELMILKKQRELEEKESSIELEIQKQLAAQKEKIIAKATASAKLELADLKNQIEEKDEKLKTAEEAELQLRKREREIEERQKRFELEVERRVDVERKTAVEKARTELEEEYKLKIKERDIDADRLKQQIDELKRKAEQGSNQVQGEAQEVELYEILQSSFKFDDITRIKKGKEGADDKMVVQDQLGKQCGTILFESKRTKSWNDGWVGKAKHDMREAKANIAVIVSRVLPAGVRHIGNIEGIWICDLQSVVELANVLREQIIQIGEARSALQGKSEKMELMYEYLSGPHFKQRVETIVEGFVAMQEGLEKEKRAMNTIWAQREKEIEKVIHSTSSLYGDVKGIVGKPLPQVKALELPSGEPSIPLNEEKEDLPF